jgi:hypothetical protein
MDAFLTSSGLVALITLTFLEIVLGVDNIIFISILSNKLSGSQQARARRLGLLGALGTRILLLFSVVCHPADRSAFLHPGTPHLWARPHLGRRWPVSTRESDD